MAIKFIIESLESDLERDDLVCEQSLITFGRSKSCTVELNNSQMSKRHFIIRFMEGQYILMDEGSTLGTMLDGEMLEPAKIYVLQEQHHIVVPGFNISVFNDGHAPRLERTLVVARKLMGKILQGAESKEQFPRLEDVNGTHLFLFSDDRTSFVLGSGSHLDFVIPDDPLVAKEHVSFIRDIFGVRLIPIMDATTKVGHEEIIESRLIKHGDLVAIGQTNFIFKEHADDSLNQASRNVVETPEHKPEETLAEGMTEPDLATAKITASYSRPAKMFDCIFLALFLLVSVGASIMLLKLA